MNELKEILLKTGNPFVWITDAGWFFNEQPGSAMFTAEEVMGVDSFEQLFVSKTAQVITENIVSEVIEETKEAKKPIKSQRKK